ncbi:hypothetical protein ES288_A04G003800v1 [Gossypium darwinii]|uniref:Uncharacterized protein n=1 Tax=Gossypium darwinii TaxID=34276 RepID=A0A5D2GS33_GOSDA|nr:hypothetical protein ES288_A04G003800v1 [Gossypium darwinii]
MQKKSMCSMEEPKRRTCILHQLICPWHYFRFLLPQRIADITRSRGNICSTTICSSAKIFQQNKNDSWELCSRELKHAMWLSNDDDDAQCLALC